MNWKAQRIVYISGPISKEKAKMREVNNSHYLIGWLIGGRLVPGFSGRIFHFVRNEFWTAQ